MTRQEILARIENSSMAGLVPPRFEIIGDDWIEFTPSEKFWKAWRVRQNWMDAIGCKVYAVRDYPRMRRKEWLCRLTLSMLDSN